ncbi:MAG TPA: hypothetical protein VGF22_20900, partial [Acidimicrobiales bacterium]
APYANFQPGPAQTRTLGCAANRAVIVGNPTQVGQLTGGLVSQVPDPKCDGSSGLETPDGLQQAIEDGKANGSGELISIDGANVPTYAVNQHLIRDYIDHHRPEYAPLYDGAFTVPIVNIMFEKDYNVALPLVVGGIAENSNGGEGWGQFDNVNDTLVPAMAIDCAHSAAAAPGCNGVPDTFRHDYGLTYTMEHEAAHFLGVNHPHDGAITVGASSDGQWHYYYEMLKWLYDISASPTTYAGSYGTYEVVDQERLMVGHAAEYSKQAQDGLSDAYFRDGAAGLTKPSAATTAQVKAAKADIKQGTNLFQKGDYLHAMYAMRNAALHGRGIGIGAPPVAPHRMSIQEAASGTNAIFTITPQKVYGSVVSPSAGDPPMWVGPPGGSGAGTGAAQAAVARAGSRTPASAEIGVTKVSFCHINWR